MNKLNIDSIFFGILIILIISLGVFVKMDHDFKIEYIKVKNECGISNE